MITFIVGIFILLFGLAIMENAAFSDRSQFGFYVFLVGALLALGAFVDVIVSVLT